MILAKTDKVVTIRRVEDGQVFELPLEKLNAADQTRMRDWTLPEMGRNDFGDQVLAFCTARMGKKVGGGECAHLASEALPAVGAQGRRADAPGKGDYVWGELVAVSPAGLPADSAGKLLSKVQPGDVVQLRDAKFSGKRPGRGTYTQTAIHHTVIVERVDAAKGVLHILHQNWNGARHVMRGQHKISDLKQGWLRIYRPVAATH